jgi:hypothetical protein
MDNPPAWSPMKEALSKGAFHQVIPAGPEESAEDAEKD